MGLALRRTLAWCQEEMTSLTGDFRIKSQRGNRAGDVSHDSRAVETVTLCSDKKPKAESRKQTPLGCRLSAFRFRKNRDGDGPPGSGGHRRSVRFINGSTLFADPSWWNRCGGKHPALACSPVSFLTILSILGRKAEPLTLSLPVCRRPRQIPIRTDRTCQG